MADEHCADLIAVGCRRDAWLDRALHGGVVTDLARDGRHALPVMPPSPTPPHPLDVLER
jgi:hypothetical protein